MTLNNIQRFGVSVAFVGAFMSAATAGDIYVQADAVGPTFDGTPSNPYKTITDAIASPAITGDTIHIAAGTYNAALEEAFPIRVPGGVSLEGPSTGSPAVIGGDLIDELGNEAPDAVIELLATSGDLADVQLRWLRILGENESNEDSPVALRIVVEGPWEVTGFVFEHNVCTRPFMNDSQRPDVATVQIEVSNASIDSQSLIQHNVIECSPRGGLEIIAAAAETETAVTDLTIDDNIFKVNAGQAAGFAVRWVGQDLGGPGQGNDEGYNGFDVFSNNTVLGRLGIGSGLVIECPEHTTFGQFIMEHNVINACTSDAVIFKADGWIADTLPEIAVSFRHNKLTANGGSGLAVYWDESSDADGAGYIVLQSEGNLIADNDEYGVEVHGRGEGSNGSLTFINDTIADNDLGAEGYPDYLVVDDWGIVPSSHRNCIVWDNGGFKQIGGLGNSGPLLAAVLSNVNYSDWGGIALTQDNIDSDPLFLDTGLHNYHISASSPCIDVGHNGVVGLELDIDHEDRTQDGDCDWNPVIDLGFDEVPEDC